MLLEVVFLVYSMLRTAGLLAVSNKGSYKIPIFTTLIYALPWSPVKTVEGRTRFAD
jgi:hypothetical protein